MLRGPSVNKKETKKVSAKLKKIAGTITLPENFDEKKELRDYIRHKHLRFLYL